MPTIERQIDALGGIKEGEGEYNAGYHDGYTRALDEAMDIGRDADALIEELIEWIEDILNGTGPLEKWASDARTMIARLKHRRA